MSDLGAIVSSMVEENTKEQKKLEKINFEKADFDAVWDIFISKNKVKVKDEEGKQQLVDPVNFLGSIAKYKKSFDEAVEEYVNNVNRITDNPDTDLV